MPEGGGSKRRHMPDALRVLGVAWGKAESRSVGIYETLAIVGIVVTIVLCTVKQSFYFSGSVLGASIIAYVLAFFLSSYGLKRQGLGWQRVFFAVAATAAARWLFEIVYHYVFPVTIATVVKNLENLSTNISEGNFPLIWSIMMVLVIFTGYRYMSVGRWFYITLGATAGLFLFWVWIGYPQWVHPEQWPVRHPLIPVIPIKYAHAPSEAAKNYIITTSLIVNSLAKVACCALLPALFLGKKRAEG